jgi:hypothetical protein
VTVDDWLQSAKAHARDRGRPELEPLLEALAQATRALRAADFDETVDDRRRPDAPTIEPSAGSRRRRDPSDR